MEPKCVPHGGSEVGRFLKKRVSEVEAAQEAWEGVVGPVRSKPQRRTPALSPRPRGRPAPAAAHWPPALSCGHQQPASCSRLGFSGCARKTGAEIPWMAIQASGPSEAGKSLVGGWGGRRTWSTQGSCVGNRRGQSCDWCRRPWGSAGACGQWQRLAVGTDPTLCRASGPLPVMPSRSRRTSTLATLTPAQRHVAQFRHQQSTWTIYSAGRHQPTALCTCRESPLEKSKWPAMHKGGQSSSVAWARLLAWKRPAMPSLESSCSIAWRHCGTAQSCPHGWSAAALTAMAPRPRSGLVLSQLEALEAGWSLFCSPALTKRHYILAGTSGTWAEQVIENDYRVLMLNTYRRVVFLAHDHIISQYMTKQSHQSMLDTRWAVEHTLYLKQKLGIKKVGVIRALKILSVLWDIS